MLIAQITDFHIKARGKIAYRVVDTAACLTEAVAAVAALDPMPDVIIATGDLTDFGRAEEYELLRELLAPLKPPIYVIPGNHDDRAAMRVAFRGDGYLPASGEFLNYTVENLPLRIVALDTLVPGEPGGSLCGERLRWLDQTLAQAPDRPSVILMHHPPFASGIEHMDSMGLVGADEFIAVLARHKQVERVFCGHVHRSIQTLMAGRVIVGTAPSTAHQVALDLRPETMMRFVMEPPGYQLHLWRPETGVVTHTAVIGHFPGPYPFYEDGAPIDD